MKFLDLFSGIGGFRLGMEQAGHKCVGFCEKDKFARKSYKAIFDTENEVEMYDITTITDEFIRLIASTGRQFFNYEENGGSIGRFELRSGRTYFIDGYLGKS
ncbi:DNA cytosine methyltransferase, partial [Enterococcus avium]|uniref:DNA cytosine methyltransferase n=1 Tax=Enterococcus avium TaxID=33945 RepID=UPI000FC00F96